MQTFRYVYRHSIGLVIDSGELISSDAWQYAVGFKEGRHSCPRPPDYGHPRERQRRHGQRILLQQDAHDGWRVPARSTTTMTRRTLQPKGTSIILERVDDTPVKVNGSVKLKVVNKGHGQQSHYDHKNQMVLTKSDGANVPLVGGFRGWRGSHAVHRIE